MSLDVASGPLFWAVHICMVLLFAAMGLSFLRLVRGPSLGDRVVALDMLSMLTVAFVGVYTIASGQAAYLDVGIGLALVAFLATVAFAWYTERRAKAERNSLEAMSRPDQRELP